jgi:ATP-dependent helicase/nuclease subunit B
MKPNLHCYGIPAGKSFVNVLADWLIQTYEPQGLLGKSLVLLPTRRACRSLQEAFLKRSEGRPLLLPRIQPIGEGDEGFTAAHDADGVLAEFPPPISPLCRELLLTRLVHCFQDKALGNGANLDQSARLARQLAQFLDDVAREELSLDTLGGLVEIESLSKHWQQTVTFLDIIAKDWPATLEEEGLSDVIPHRNRLLHAMATIWKNTPPAYPVIAAGSTGSQPAASALLTVIAGLPQGSVILPALDLSMPDSQWEMLGPTHPQYALKQLLAKMDCPRSAIQLLDSASITGAPDSRTQCLQTIFQPPAATRHWPALTLPLADGLSQVKLIKADTQYDEARMIAIALRETLETPAKTAALITPDRTLARMVAAQMQRFGITLDDSAGKPLKDTPAATLMRISLQMITSAAAPAALLGLLRHPLTGTGRSIGDCRLLSRLLEEKILRGIRLTPGLDALYNHKASQKHPELQQLIGDLRNHTQPFLRLLHGKQDVALRALLSAHIHFMEWLASTDTAKGTSRLWAGEAGNALASWLAQLMEHADRLAPIDPYSYGGLIDTLLSDQVYRPRHGLHPRLHILGPMEARLQHFDRVILAGLNEGVWPGETEADPWMSRPMRETFGLPSPEYAIGLAAHDMYSYCHSPEVILTRSVKTEGTPTVPSRWLVRLHTLVEGLDKPFFASMQVTDDYLQAKQALDAPADMPPLQVPAPTPPVTSRPRKMSITDIDKWVQDPYVIYAKYILGLHKMAPLDEDPGNRDFGEIVHKSLELFCQRWPNDLPADAHARLIACGRESFAEYLNRPALACLWWPRFEHLASWLVECEQQRRGQGITVLAERKGEWSFAVDGTDFTLRGRIDRIELHPDGGMIISDYKTGNPPAATMIDKHQANQLPLGALMILNGEMTPPIFPHPTSLAKAEYWHLANQPEKRAIKDFSNEAKQGIDAWLEETQSYLTGLIRRFDQHQEAYTAASVPSSKQAFNDYEHLTRRKEWEAM